MEAYVVTMNTYDFYLELKDDEYYSYHREMAKKLFDYTRDRISPNWNDKVFDNDDFWSDDQINMLYEVYNWYKRGLRDETDIFPAKCPIFKYDYPLYYAYYLITPIMYYAIIFHYWDFYLALMEMTIAIFHNSEGDPLYITANPIISRCGNDDLSTLDMVYYECMLLKHTTLNISDIEKDNIDYQYPLKYLMQNDIPELLRFIPYFANREYIQYLLNLRSYKSEGPFAWACVNHNTCEKDIFTYQYRASKAYMLFIQYGGSIASINESFAAMLVSIAEYILYDRMLETDEYKDLARSI